MLKLGIHFPSSDNIRDLLSLKDRIRNHSLVKKFSILQHLRTARSVGTSEDVGGLTFFSTWRTIESGYKGKLIVKVQLYARGSTLT